MWNVPGYENMAANPDYENFRVCLVARQIPVEPVDGSSALYDIPQPGRETLLFLRIWSCIIAFSAILLVLAFLWRKERRELSRRIAAHTANLYFEWKLRSPSLCCSSLRGLSAVASRATWSVSCSPCPAII